MTKIIWKLLLLFITAPWLTFAVTTETNPEIRIHLATASSLQPLYVGKIHAQNSTFDATYLAQLENILCYDLNYNGATKVTARSPEKEQLISAKDPAAAFNHASWKGFGISYVLRCQLSDRSLSVSIFSVQNGNAKTFADIPLNGNLNSDRRQIHKLADSIHKALFDSDGVATTRILYAYQIKNPRPDGREWISEIWECDWDGANAKQLTHDGSYCVTPVVLPYNPKYNNERFLYVSYKTGQPKIYIGSLKGGEGKRLIDLRGNQLLPAISPNRDKIAFICDAAGRTDLFLQACNPETGEVGTPVQLYSHPRSTQASPTFSPDGSKVAFVSDKDGGMRIYVIPTIASEKRANAQMISKQNRENSCPCWSPDGTKLAYSAKTNGVRQIWIYDFATGEERQLTSGPDNKENPSWAPSSKHLVFNSTDSSSSELYIANIYQPEAIKISRGPGKKHYPTWGTH